MRRHSRRKEAFKEEDSGRHSLHESVMAVKGSKRVKSTEGIK